MSNILHNYKFKKMENNFDSIEIENAIMSFPDFGFCNKINEECLKNYLIFDILMLFIEKLFEVDNLKLCNFPNEKWTASRLVTKL
jgi:hypothetical protein